LLVSESSAADLQALTTTGMATASIHSTDYGDSFFYFNHAAEQPWPDNVQSNNFYLGTQWHLSHGIPISRICANTLFGDRPELLCRPEGVGHGVFPYGGCAGNHRICHTRRTVAGRRPYRLYETPQPGQVNWPTYYADWFSVPGHPEFDGQFFNVYSEVRDAASCGEWCPSSDVAGSISRATPDGETGVG